MLLRPRNEWFGSVFSLHFLPLKLPTSVGGVEETSLIVIGEELEVGPNDMNYCSSNDLPLHQCMRCVVLSKSQHNPSSVSIAI